MIRFFLLPFLALFLLSACNIEYTTTQEEKVIGILPYNGINQTDIDSVQQTLKNVYSLEVIVLDQIDLPESAFTNRKSPRYRADSLLNFQLKNIPDSIDIIIGLTNRDISNTKIDPTTMNVKEPQNKYVDWGIFGLGQVGGKSCVVSTFRLKNNADSQTYFTRLTRISTHEVGHVLGLLHCPTSKCLMNSANESIKTIDNSTGELCDKCWSKIK